MEYLILIALVLPVKAETISLDFQKYDGYIYPEEESGECLEGPFSSEWIEIKTEDKTE